MKIRVFFLIAIAGWVAAFAAATAQAQQLIGPNPYDGRPNMHCNAPTHVSYYDPRNGGQTIWNTTEASGDSVYYVDTEPLTGFEPGGSYSTTQTPEEDCKGTPVLRATGYVAITVDPPFGDTQHIGIPPCPRDDDRNPRCEDEQTGVRGAFFIGTHDASQGFGQSGGVIVP